MCVSIILDKLVKLLPAPQKIFITIEQLSAAIINAVLAQKKFLRFSPFKNLKKKSSINEKVKFKREKQNGLP